MNNPNPTVADLIRQARGTRPLRDFGQQLGVSHTAVSNWESGASLPGDENLQAWYASRNVAIATLAIEIYTIRYRATLQALAEACYATA